MFRKIHYERFIVCTLGIGMITFICFLWLLFIPLGSYEKGTLGHFVGWFASKVWHLLSIPAVVILEKMKVPINGWILLIAFAADSLLYGFLIERIITVFRIK